MIAYQWPGVVWYELCHQQMKQANTGADEVGPFAVVKCTGYACDNFRNDKIFKLRPARIQLEDM